MKILLLGYSKIAKKRVLNYFKKKEYIISIASLSYKKKIKNISEQFNSYDVALKKSKANIVYISLPNSLHYKWAYKALELGYHVIVDKPLCDTPNELNKLINLSYQNKKLLCEATYFNYHDQFNKLIKTIGHLNNINKVKCVFTIPMPHKDSLLRSNSFKGGVLMDMGPYASSIARIFFNERILSKQISMQRNEKKLITSIKFLIKYKNKSYYGNFKFGGKYKNNLTVYYKSNSIAVNRVFSPPSDQNLELINKFKKSISTIKIKKDDCFANFFSDVTTKIKNKDYYFFIDQMKFDNFFRNKILKVKKTIKKYH